MSRKTITLILLTLVLMLGITTVASAQVYNPVPYRVQPGDTLSKIAVKYCTTWQEIYDHNRGIIGENPDVVEPGTLIYVTDRCGGGSGVYDRGARLHASGSVHGNVYTVARGDTFYSIGQRFGVPWKSIVLVNGLQNEPKLDPGDRLVIPGLAQTAPPAQPSMVITSPTAYSAVGNNFTASGTASGLHEGNVVVTLKDQFGSVIATQPTVLQGAQAGLGGPGVWSTNFSGIYAPYGSAGLVEAYSPETGAYASVSIYFR